MGSEKVDKIFTQFLPDEELGEKHFHKEGKSDNYYKLNIPLSLLDAGLSPEALSMYLYIKREKSRENPAPIDIESALIWLDITRTTFEKCIEEIQNGGLFANEPLIKIISRSGDDNKELLDIEICNIWRSNGEFCRQIEEFYQPEFKFVPMD